MLNGFLVFECITRTFNKTKSHNEQIILLSRYLALSFHSTNKSNKELKVCLELFTTKCLQVHTIAVTLKTINHPFIIHILSVTMTIFKQQ